MSLRGRMRVANAGVAIRARYEKYGVLDNPFPAAGKPYGHPRMEDEIDDEVEHRIREFETDNRSSQILVIEGTQGVGKTNLLSYYEQQFREYYGEDETFYIIRYYPDPEPSFDSVLRKIFQSFDQSHFEEIGITLARSNKNTRDEAKEAARSHEVRIVLNSLEKAGPKCQNRRTSWSPGRMRQAGVGVVCWIKDIEASSRSIRRKFPS